MPLSPPRVLDRGRGLSPVCGSPARPAYTSRALCSKSTSPTSCSTCRRCPSARRTAGHGCGGSRRTGRRRGSCSPDFGCDTSAEARPCSTAPPGTCVHSGSGPLRAFRSAPFRAFRTPLAARGGAPDGASRCTSRRSKPPRPPAARRRRPSASTSGTACAPCRGCSSSCTCFRDPNRQRPVSLSHFEDSER